MGISVGTSKSQLHKAAEAPRLADQTSGLGRNLSFRNTNKIIDLFVFFCEFFM